MHPPCYGSMTNMLCSMTNALCCIFSNCTCNAFYQSTDSTLTCADPLAFTPTFLCKNRAEASRVVVTIAVLIIFFIAVSFRDVPYWVLHQCQRSDIEQMKKESYWISAKLYKLDYSLTALLDRNCGDGKLSHIGPKRFG